MAVEVFTVPYAKGRGAKVADLQVELGLPINLSTECGQISFPVPVELREAAAKKLRILKIPVNGTKEDTE